MPTEVQFYDRQPMDGKHSVHCEDFLLESRIVSSQMRNITNMIQTYEKNNSEAPQLEDKSDVNLMGQVRPYTNYEVFCDLSGYNCIICHEIVHEPIQITTCGHRACSGCWKTYNGALKDLVCPQCSTPTTSDDIMLDRGIEKEIERVFKGNPDNRVANKVTLLNKWWYGMTQEKQPVLKVAKRFASIFPNDKSSCCLIPSLMKETSLVFIYVDTNTSPNFHFYEKLQLLNDRALIFHDQDSFLEYNRTHYNQQTTLVLSIALVDEIVRQVQHLQNVYSVYIHHDEADQYHSLLSSCSKVKAIYRNPDNLFSQIGIDFGLRFFKQFEWYKQNGNISAANEYHRRSMEMYNIVNEYMKEDGEEIKN